MAKSLIKKLVAGPVTLPDPFSDVILTPEAPSVVVDGAPATVITQLGGAARINGVLAVSAAPDANAAGAVALGLADVQADAAAAAVTAAAAIALPRTSFVYRPGDPLGAHENVYIDWPAMFAAMANVEGHKAVFVDDSFTSPAIVPAGAYDLTDVRIEGADNFLTLLHLADGAVFTSGRTLLAFAFKSITLRNLGTAAVMTLTAGQSVSLESTFIEATGAAPLISMAGGNVLIASALSAVVDAGTPPVATTTGPVFVLVLEGCAIDDDVFSGAGAVALTVGSNSARVGAQTVLGGAFSVNSNSPLLAVMADRWQVPAVGTLTGVHGAMHRVDTTGGSVTINLPVSIPGTIGQAIIGKKITGEAINDVIMNPAGEDTIEGADRTTGTAFGVIHLVDNGDGSWSTIHPTGE